MAKTLELQVKEVETAIEAIDRQIEENPAEAAGVEARLPEVSNRIEAINAESVAARGDRQKALAAGGDVKSLSRRLKQLQEEKEEREDEVAGLGTRLEGIKVRGAQLQTERNAKKRRIPILKYQDAARCYNVLAAQLGPIVLDLCQLRSELREPPEGRAVLSPQFSRRGPTLPQRGFMGALEAIPRLFIPGEEGILEVADPAKHFFFDSELLVVTHERKREARLLTVDEDPPPNPSDVAEVSS